MGQHSRLLYNAVSLIVLCTWGACLLVLFAAVKWCWSIVGLCPAPHSEDSYITPLILILGTVGISSAFLLVLFQLFVRRVAYLGVSRHQVSFFRWLLRLDQKLMIEALFSKGHHNEAGRNRVFRSRFSAQRPLML